MLEACLKTNSLVLINGKTVKIQSHGIPNLHNEISEDDLKKYSFPDEEELDKKE